MSSISKSARVLANHRITFCSKSTCDQRREKSSLYVLPPVWERRMIATRRWTGAAPKMRFSSSSVSILRVGLSRSSLKCLTSAAGFSARYFIFIAKSSMHFKHSSSRLTVAPFTVDPNLFRLHGRETHRCIRDWAQLEIASTIRTSRLLVAFVRSDRKMKARLGILPTPFPEKTLCVLKLAVSDNFPKLPFMLPNCEAISKIKSRTRR